MQMWLGTHTALLVTRRSQAEAAILFLLLREVLPHQNGGFVDKFETVLAWENKASICKK